MFQQRITEDLGYRITEDGKGLLSEESTYSLNETLATEDLFDLSTEDGSYLTTEETNLYYNRFKLESENAIVLSEDGNSIIVSEDGSAIASETLQSGDSTFLLEDGSYLLQEDSNQYSDANDLSATITITTAYDRRLLEDGTYRLLETGNYRLLESSVDYGDFGDLLGTISISSPSAIVDLAGKINIFHTDISDLSGKVFVFAKSDLLGKIRVVYPGTSDFPATLEVTHLPNYQRVDINGRIVIPKLVDVSTPLFSWYNSTDYDLDTKTYQLQVAPYYAWESGFTYSGIAENPSGITSFRITDNLTADIIYTWRVRSWDGYEWSDWSSELAVIYTAKRVVDLNARVYIGPHGDLTCIVHVLPHTADLSGKVNVTIPPEQTLAGKINVTLPSYRDMAGTIYVDDTYQRLSGKITVTKPSYGDLSGKINVTDAYQRLYAKITVTTEYERDLYGKITVDDTYQRLYGTIKVLQTAQSDLSGMITVDDAYQRLYGKITVDDSNERLYGKVFVLQNVVLDGKIKVLQYGEKDLNGKIYLPSIGSSDLNGKATVSQPGHSDVYCQVTVPPYSDINSTIYVIPFKDLNGKIFVYHALDLAATINVTPYSDLSAKVTIFSHSDLSATIRVGFTYSDLNGKARVDRFSDLNGMVFVCQHVELNGKINLTIPPEQTLAGKVNVSGRIYGDLSAQITIMSHVELNGKIDVLVEGYNDLNAKIIVAVYPLDVVISADIPEGVWQNQSVVHFTWTDAEDLYHHYGCYYYYKVNQDPNYVVTAVDILNGSTRASTITFEESGHWYFHVRAKNYNGYLAPHTAHFHVMFNHLPTAPQPPFLVDELTSPATIYRNNPLFKWNGATDADVLDVLTYRLEIARDIGFTDIHANISGIVISGGNVQYQLTDTNKLSTGTYYWRVFAFDGKQEGPSSDINTLIAESTPSDINGKVLVGYYQTGNLNGKITVAPYVDLPAVLYVIPYRDLNGKVTVIHAVDLAGTINIPPSSTLSGKVNVDVDYQRLYGKINVLQSITKDLSAKIAVDDAYQRLYGKVTVSNTATSDLYGKLTITGILNGKIRVVYYEELDLAGKILVGYPDYSDLSAQVYVISHLELAGTVKVLQSSQGDLYGKVNVNAIKPVDVVISADVPEAVWQNQSVVHFTWTDAEDPYFHYTCYYYYQINRIADYVVTDTDVLNGSTRARDITFEDSGHWYFHVRAKNTNGYFAPDTAHFHVMYDNIPTAPQPPFLIEDQISPAVIYIDNPTFKWGYATDPDTTDVLTYRLEIARDIGFTDIHANISGIVPASGHTEYKLLEANKVSTGVYYWRMYASDGWEESVAGTTNVFEAVPTTTDLSAKVTIGTYSTSNLLGKINIIDYSNLNGTILIKGSTYSDISGKIRVVYYDDVDLLGKVGIVAYRDLYAKIHIINYSNLNAKVFIIANGNSDLSGKIKVGYYSDVDLSARATIRYGSKSDLEAMVFIIANGHGDLNGKINVFVPNSDLSGTIKIWRNTYSSLLGRVNVTYAYPGNVILSCNVAEGVWQENNNIVFTWLPVQAGQNPVHGYYYKLDHSSSTPVDSSFFFTPGLETDYNLEDYEGASSYYYHICAVDSIGRVGNVRSFNVKYNNKPSAPHTPLTVNGIDSVGQNPLIATSAPQNFAWIFATDIDYLDTQSYTIQIASDEEFTNIVFNVAGIAVTNYDINLNNKLTSGYYYWRVRSFDGHEYGDWSITAHFFVNTPPTVPTDLEVSGG